MKPLSDASKILAIAQVCHEANRAYCRTLGDNSQLPFLQAPAWQTASAISQVEQILIGAVTTPAQAHTSWMDEKVSAGWQYGPEKDGKLKTHPCLVPWDDLPITQRNKDRLFFAIVQVLR